MAANPFGGGGGFAPNPFAAGGAPFAANPFAPVQSHRGVGANAPKAPTSTSSQGRSGRASEEVESRFGHRGADPLGRNLLHVDHLNPPRSYYVGKSRS